MVQDLWTMPPFLDSYSRRFVQHDLSFRPAFEKALLFNYKTQIATKRRLLRSGRKQQLPIRPYANARSSAYNSWLSNRAIASPTGMSIQSGRFASSYLIS